MDKLFSPLLNRHFFLIQTSLHEHFCLKVLWLTSTFFTLNSSTFLSDWSKLMASERFPLLPLDYGTSSPLKFELVLMLIVLNLSWKRYFLKRHMTLVPSYLCFILFYFFYYYFLFYYIFYLFIYFIIIFFLPFLWCVCYKYPNMYSRVICKLVLNDIVMSFFTL